MSKSRGFTLIELMVVIAILAILASLILYVLSSARARAIDSNIVQNMRTVSTQAAIFYTSYNSYLNPSSSGFINGECRAIQGVPPFIPVGPSMLVQDNIIFNAIVRSIKLSGMTTGGSSPTIPTYRYSQCYNSAGKWAVAVPLRSGNKPPYKSWCVDSTGKSKVFNQLPFGAIETLGPTAGQCK